MKTSSIISVLSVMSALYFAIAAYGRSGNFVDLLGSFALFGSIWMAGMLWQTYRFIEYEDDLEDLIPYDNPDNI